MAQKPRQTTIQNSLSLTCKKASDFLLPLIRKVAA